MVLSAGNALHIHLSEPGGGFVCSSNRERVLESEIHEHPRKEIWFFDGQDTEQKEFVR